MKDPNIVPTLQEKVMRDEDFIVSKTDPKGIITYGNRIFIEFSGYSERELIGSQHNIIRHPDMPRGVFAYLWANIAKGNEVFAYVKNMAKDGSFYWVFTHVTPDYDANGKIVGYFSVRRKPKASGIKTVVPVYEEMVKIEKHVGPARACEASLAFLVQQLTSMGVSYEQFVMEI